MNEFERVRLHPHLHGLVAVYGDFSHVIFRGAIYSLLQDFAFTALEISTVAEQNKVTITASRRNVLCDIEKTDTRLILAIGGVSVKADFNIEYQDGSLRKCTIKNAIPDNEHFLPVPSETMTRFECTFILPDEHPVDKSFARSMVYRFSKVFPHSRINYNNCEYFGKSEKKNKISWFLHHRSFDKNAAKIFEFNGREDNYSWEISFSFDGMAKDNSFINGVKTDFGGTHVGMVKTCIRHILQKISGEKSISLKKLNLALSFHVPPEEIIIQGGLVSLHDFNELVSTPSEFHLISKEFSRQLTAYFTANPNELYEILKKCK